MAATDLLVEVGDPGSATTLSSPGYTSGSSTSINVASTSNWPSTGKAVIFAIDEAEVVDGEEVQVAGTYNEYEGTVASATSVSNVAWQRGSGDRNYSAGSLTRVYIPVSAERENRLVEWGEHEHDVNGNHDKEIITDRTADTSPASDDLILTSDTSASGALKKVTIANAKSVEVADSVNSTDIDFGGAGAGVWWEEIGRTTLSSAGASISVTSLPARTYLMVVAFVVGSSSAASTAYQFNGDTGSNYSARRSTNGGADSTGTSAANANIAVSLAVGDIAHIVSHIVNYQTREKVAHSVVVAESTGAANAPDRYESAQKWSNTSDQISRIDLIASAGQFAAGSEVVVLGHD